jgi:branched-chain amino acid aminotransferase
VELITPPSNELILPGVLRRSVLDLTREWGEFKVTERAIKITEVILAIKQKRVVFSVI